MNLSSFRAAHPVRKSRPIPKKAGLICFRDAALFLFRTPVEKMFRIIFSEDFPGQSASPGLKFITWEGSFAAGTFIFACIIEHCRYEQRLGSCSALQRRRERR